MLNKKRITKTDVAVIFAISLCLLSIILSIVGNDSVYGSAVDWASQHSVFPDYFRKLFYQTGELFPSLAQNIGGAENIYFISYYGLLSPVILLSYLLPFVEMTDYIVAASVVSLFLTVIFFYFWIRRRYPTLISAVLTSLLALAGPMIFHSHRHIMFVIYMPFLIAALYFVDIFFEKNIKAPLAICVFLIVMTSYFFSVSAIIAITVYGIFKFLECEGTKVSLSSFVKAGGKFALVVTTGVLMSAILVLPTAFALLGGRNPTNSGIGLVDLLPNVMLEEFTSGGYSMGLSTFTVFAIIDLIVGEKKHFRFLAAVFGALLTCPILLYLLNGFEYLDGKVLVPFITLALVACGKSIERIFEGAVNYKIVIPLFVIVTVIGLFNIDKDSSYVPCIVDLVVVLALCSAAESLKMDNFAPKLAAIALLAVPLVNCIVLNDSDTLLSKSKYDTIYDDTVAEFLDKTAATEDTIVRTAYNFYASDTPNIVFTTDHYTDTLYSSLRDSNYNHFFFDVFCNENSYRNRAIMSRTKNPFFNTYMGNKYWITKTDGGYIPENSVLIDEKNGLSLYEMSGSLPVGYATSRLMSLDEFETLAYPERMEALLLYTVVDCDLPKTDFSSSFEKVELDGLFDGFESLYETDGKFRYVTGDGETKYSYKLPDCCKGKTLVLRFDVDNTVGSKSSDVKIWVNGVANKLTAADWKYYNENSSFEYVITPKGSDGDLLSFTFPDKDYTISNVELWICDFDEISDRAIDVDAFSADKERSIGDNVCGKINVTSDGYFNLSYVYSDGYTVLVDGVAVEPECVDTCFLGFPITAGEHEIEITYTSPGQNIGKIVSLVGVFALICLGAVDVVNAKRKNRVS